MIIAMDIATKTGIAAGIPCGEPVCWTEDLGEGDDRFAALLRITNRIIKDHKPAEIVVEAPMVHPGKGSAHTMRFLIGTVACVVGTARYLRVPVIEVKPATVRKHFLGKPPVGRAAIKKAVVGQCETLGWAPKNDNEGDALSIWDWRCSVLSREHAIKTAGMFGHAQHRSGAGASRRAAAQ